MITTRLNISFFLKTLILMQSIATTILCWVPPISRDALTHHLAIPKLYLLHKGIYEIPNMPFSYYPMIVDYIYTIPLIFGYDIFPKLLHYGFALATAFFIFRYIETRITRIWGMTGALFFLGIPIIIRLSTEVYVDLALTFFTTASMLTLLKWMNSEYKIKCIIIAGIYAGLAVSTKYNGLVSLFLLTCLVPFLFQRTTTHSKSNKIALSYALLFFFTALIIFAPWPIRNYLWTGNPLYPLYNSFFNPGDPHIPETLGPLLNRKFFYNENLWMTLTIPIRIFFQGIDDSHQYFDGKLSPFLLLLPPITFLFKNKRLPLRIELQSMAYFAILFIIIAYFQRIMRIRYIVPILPVLVILSIFSLNDMYQFINKIDKIDKQHIKKGCLVSFFLLLMSIFTYNFLYIKKRFSYTNPLQYQLNKISRQQYILHFRPEYDAIQFINSTLPQDTQILCLLLGNRGYYLDRPYLFDTWLNTGFLHQFSLQNNASEIARQFNLLGITHFLIRTDLVKTWLAEDFTAEQIKVTETFFKEHTKFLYSSNNYTVLQLK